MIQILNSKSKYLFSIILKLVIVIFAFYFIYYKIFVSNQLNINNAFFQITTNTNFIVFNLILLLSIFNWIFEIKKWQNLVEEIKSITFFESLQQSLGSLTASLITPNRIGEYGAKAIYYSKSQQKKVLFLNFLSNLSQMLITTLFGIIGFLFISKSLEFSFHFQRQNMFIIVILLFMVSAVTFYLRRYLWKKFLKKLLFYFNSLSRKTVLNTLKFSLFRYLIFSHQFYFFLMIFGVELDYFTAMGIILSMYFIASVIPSIVIFDFIIKGSVAISLFGIFGVNELVILTITTIMWLLNFALPSIIGSYFVLTFEFPKPIKIPTNTK